MDDNWALFQSQYRQDLPLFAAILVGRTAKTVRYARRHEGEPDEVITRKHDWLVIDGITEEAAKQAQEDDRDSRKILDQQRTEARSAHLMRRSEIIKKAKAGSADSRSAKTQQTTQESASTPTQTPAIAERKQDISA